MYPSKDLYNPLVEQFIHVESLCLTEEIVPQIKFELFYWAILFVK